MGIGLKGIPRTWGPGLVSISGCFTVVSSAIVAASQRPSQPGWTISRKAAGVYVVTLSWPFQSLISSDCSIGPSSAATGTLPTSATTAGSVQISKDFITCDAGGANYAADTTGTKVLILCTSGGVLADPAAAGYRISFDLWLAESEVNH